MAGREERKRSSRKKRYILPVLIFCAVLFAASGALYLLAAHVPGFADAYAGVMNPVMVNTQGRLAGLLPFSIAELLLCALIPAGAFWLIRLVQLSFGYGTRDGGMHRFFLRTAAALLCAAAVMSFLFMLNEGVYFFRTSFADRYGFRNGGYTNEELEEVCRMAADEVNHYAGKVRRDGNGRMIPNAGLNRRIRGAMQQAGERWPYLSGWYPPVKPVFFSRALDYMQFTGIYSIYTLEANYNRGMPAFNIPFTMAHELSHLKGVMNEKEANFAAYLASTCSNDPDIRYSGAMLAWTYCGNELYRRDHAAWEAIARTIDERANTDIRYNRAYWNSFEGTVAETTEAVNDSYLKQMGVTEGTASYDLVVDLIVTYETDRED